MSLLQYLDGLPDRQAVEMLRYHAGWNFALNRQLGDELFHATTLVNFRQRLLDHDHSALGFKTILDALAAAELVSRQSRQRLDSTQMFGLVSRMSRLDCVRESLRLALQELEPGVGPESRPEFWLELWERYVESQTDYRAGSEALGRKLVEAGTDAARLLAWARGPAENPVARGPQLSLLERVFGEQFELSGAGTAPKNKTELRSDRVQNPHDAQATYAVKGEGAKKKEHVGYKVQVAETVTQAELAPGEPTQNFLTGIVTHAAQQSDATGARATRLALAQVLAPGCRTISRIIAACGLDQRDWSADYRVFSRSPWQQQRLFEAPIAAGLAYFQGRDHIAVAGDFTHLAKTGKHIPNVHCLRDPMSPPFHVNLICGLRFIPYTLLLPLYANRAEDDDAAPPRSIPVCFKEVPVIAKPGKKATDEEQAAYKSKLRKRPANHMALAALRCLRAQFDAAGAADKDVLSALDGGFCNKVFCGNKLDRIELVARARKDARLCFAAQPGGRRFYAKESFTPESVRTDESRPWSTGRFFHGGAWRELRYKEITGVFWPNGAGRRPLRLAGCDALSQLTQRQNQLPPTRLSVNHRLEAPGGSHHSMLSRPLADRSQPSRGEKQLRRW